MTESSRIHRLGYPHQTQKNVSHVLCLAALPHHAQRAQEPGPGSTAFMDDERLLLDTNNPPPSSWNPSPFTLATLAGRFAPAIVDPSELRDRAGARVRVVTPAGLRVGLARRVFAREPLLPSDVEAEEEQQVGWIKKRGAIG